MSIKLNKRRYYARARRHEGECYAPAVGPGELLAWLRVEDKRERLMLQTGPDAEPAALTEPTYVYDPCFAAGCLVWSQRTGRREWALRAVRVDEGGVAGDVFDPVRADGRPMSLSAAADAEGDGAWLVWEQRDGRRTRVLLSRIAGGRFGEPVAVTDGTFNAYDPGVAVATDGSPYVVFCAFLDGHYRIAARRLDGNGAPVGDVQRFSNGEHACVYPSVAARRDGGVWISYTHLKVLGEANVGGVPEIPCLQHYRAAEQHHFFRSHGIVCTGVLDGERTFSPIAPPPGAAWLKGPGRGGCLAAGVVFGTLGAGHSRIFEDADGRVRLLVRRHQEPTEDPRYADDDDPLARPDRPGLSDAHHTQPDLLCLTLADDAWSEPATLIPRAHHEAPISARLDVGRLVVGFTQDARSTGWNRNGEWFDDAGTLAVGLAEIGLDRTGEADYELRPYRLTARPGPSMVEPDVPRRGFAVGQTHKHTNLSVCAREWDREVNLNYRFMQDVQHCDFGAVTDHESNMWWTEMLVMRKAAEFYYVPGEFVAIPATEWAGSNAADRSKSPGGHVNPLWLGETGDLEIYTPCDPSDAGSTLDALWTAYDGLPVLTPPHHVADSSHPYEWRYFDERFEPVVEIFQDYRGSGESPLAPGTTNYLHRDDDGWVLDALRSGKRFAFIGGGDHFGLARAGVRVTELTRTALLAGFRSRECFATTGCAMHLSLACNGVAMGSAVQAERGEFRLIVETPEPIAEVHVVRDGETVETIRTDDTRFEHVWTADRRRPGEFWYVRIILANGEIGWTSPIWMD